ncbi:hypothetical protein [Pseudocitrobacter cyperus]|uniref:Lipoprotein n=1 Tax=Pseudocitrobacter cyperus TaxID=3112843 RepID=A0ABV0HHV9_9ENTR
MMNKLLILSLVISISAISCAEAAYRSCMLSGGEATHCSGLANANHFPIEQSNGQYRDCQVVGGDVTGC